MKLINKLFPLWALLALAMTSHAFAQISGEGVSVNRVVEGKTISLPRCGGTARLGRVQGALTLQVRGATCANLLTSKGTWKLNGTRHGERWINVHFDETVPGDKMVLIGSNAYIASEGTEGNGDYITVKVPAKRVTLNLTSARAREINLKYCNGSVRASIVNGSVVVSVYNTGCPIFDILANDWANFRYSPRAIPLISLEEGYSGSFTIPNQFYDRGLNGIVIRFLSPRLIEEEILIKFNAR